MRNCYLYSILILLFTFSSKAQVTNLHGIINEYIEVTEINVTENYVEVAKASFINPGLRVLIIQMKGASADLSNTSNFGKVTDFGNAGNFEFNTVACVIENRIYFKYKFARTYNIEGLVQIVSVPQYKNGKITQQLSALAWNGKTGGVLVFEVENELEFIDKIDVSGKGFHGGKVFNYTGANCGKTDYFYNGSSDFGSEKGESFVVSANNYLRGRGALANGGGGGNDHNAGGGGGSNAGAGGKGGYQWKGCGIQTDNGGAGGWNVPYKQDFAKLFLGGGGGAGHNNSAGNTGTDGGNGGGIVIVRAKKITSQLPEINVSGISVTKISHNDACGGGGGGGSILWDVEIWNGKMTNFNLNGGNGGSTNFDAVGPGGGGGGGVVWQTTNHSNGFSFYAQKAGKVIPANIHFGAEEGKEGISFLDTKVPEGKTLIHHAKIEFVTTLDTTICAGDSIQLWVKPKNVNDIGNFVWSDNLGTGNKKFVSPKNTKTFWVFSKSECQAADTIFITVNVKQAAQIFLPTDTTICEGETIELSALVKIPDQTQYKIVWNNGLGEGESKIVSPKITTTYSVVLTGFCRPETASVTIHVLPMNYEIGFPKDTTICEGGEISLVAPEGNGFSYLWSDGSTSSTLKINKPGKYWLLTKNNCGEKSDTIIIKTIAKPVFSLGEDFIHCEENGNFEINGPEGDFAYAWSDGSTERTITTSIAGTYTLTVFNAFGCSFTDSIEITPCPPSIFIPNVFTPDGNSNNDFFKISGYNITNFELNIYNRWGELLFTSENINTCWDGTYKTKPCQNDVYLYILYYEGWRGKQKEKQWRHGTITLLR